MIYREEKRTPTLRTGDLINKPFPTQIRPPSAAVAINTVAILFNQIHHLRKY